MCGITGFLGGPYSREERKDIIIKMASKLQKRGPDNLCTWIDESNHISLAHTRLSIIDKSDSGLQPMFSSNKRLVITFNGEIYNHKELKKDLENSGYQISWKGYSDTEILINCIEAWGISKTLEKCVGMFAFALWDTKKQTLILARDRFGEKPLYYGQIGKGKFSTLVFSSELKALKEHPAFHQNIDKNALSSYLKTMTVTGYNSIFEDIKKVVPGTFIIFNKDKEEQSIEKYWVLEDLINSREINEKEFHNPKIIKKNLEKLLINSVSQQMLADVPVGAFLSGGIDSSTIVALMQSQSSIPIKTFSIGFTEKEYDESRYASKISKHLATEHNELILSPSDVTNSITTITGIYDEPFADSSQIPTYLVSSLAKSQVTVSLTGDAGDELFCGYNRYRFASTLWPLIKKSPKLLKSILKLAINLLSPSEIENILENIPISNNWNMIGDKVYKVLNTLNSNNINTLYEKLISNAFKESSLILNDQFENKNFVEIPHIKLNDVEHLMLLDLINYLPNDILAKVDRASMGNSLETRIPFLDHRVVSYAWQIPLKYKLNKTKNKIINKWILREILYEYVPKDFFERPKSGFGIPLGKWLRGPLKEWANDLLSENSLKKYNLINSKKIQKIWDEHLSCKKNHEHSLWTILVFQSWCQDNI